MKQKYREHRLAVHAAEQPTRKPNAGGTAASQPLCVIINTDLTMDKNQAEFIKIAIEELLNKRFDFTKQFLLVHQIVIENELPIISRIAIETDNNHAAVYFSVKDEKFFFVIYLQIQPNIQVKFVNVENAHRVYFTATSRTKTYQEMLSLLNLDPLEGYSIGNRKNFIGKSHDHSRIIFEPIKNQAYDLNHKLYILLEALNLDKQNVINLAQLSNAYISIHRYQYVSGHAGINFPQNIIQQLSDLKLSIDIDSYVVGNLMK